jgi:hypothetical protein
LRDFQIITLYLVEEGMRRAAAANCEARGEDMGGAWELEGVGEGTTPPTHTTTRMTIAATEATGVAAAAVATDTETRRGRRGERRMGRRRRR